jgi:hypothetical protein
MPRRSDKLAIAVAAVLALAATSGAVFAQPQKGRSARAPQPVITGAWSFQTAPYDGDRDGRACSMKGSMVIVQGRTPDLLTCTFTATETCPFGEWTAEQTCTAKRTGAQLEISSTITRVTPPTVNYAPDNWILTIRTSDLMIGELRSADVANVQFRRGPAYVS